MFKRLLVPLDGSLLAESALPVAAEIAKATGATVTLIHLIEKNAPSKVHGERHLTNESEALAYLEDACKKFFPPEIDVQQHVHSEEVEDIPNSLVDHIRELDPDLVVMCAHGNSSWRTLLVSNIAQNIITKVPIPILLLQPGEDPTPVQLTHFLVPLDGDPVHETVLPIACDLSAAVKASIHLLTVVHTLDTLPNAEGEAGRLLPGATRAILEETADDARKYLENKAEETLLQTIPVILEIRRGDPAVEIVESAEGHGDDLICLGTHGRSGMGAFWSGSLGARVIAGSRLPILLVPVKQSKASE